MYSFGNFSAFLLESSWTSPFKYNLKNWRYHQLVSPILNYKSTNFSNEYLLWFLFQVANWEKKPWFGPIRSFFSFFDFIWSLFSFSTAQTEKTSWKKNRETNWWKHVMNSWNILTPLWRIKNMPRRHHWHVVTWHDVNDWKAYSIFTEESEV